MGNATLTIFSICIQASVGIVLFIAIAKLLNKEGIFKNATLVAAGLGIIGMLASVFHLGQPMKAFFALYQFSSSLLSREIWFTAIFVALVVLAALIFMLKPENKGIITGLIVVAALVGLIDIGLMGAIYSNASVPFWQTSATFVEFYMAAISMGAILFLFLSLQEANFMKKILAVTIAAAVAIQIAVVIPNLINLSISSSMAIQSSLVILSSMSLAGLFEWLFILAGAILAVWVAKDELSPSINNLVLSSAVLLLVGQTIGRYLFYAAMVVTGIGIS
ncbi:MAG: dimethyl sulfoxide reductase anchor subunit [Syntrophomonadaceae bacterium]|nr:dimethyl sulfoxide reductase anchor subunit [Syntrophomonadaceae bacterium]